MKRPTWATVTGIIMIVLGGCSVLNDLQSVNFPEKLEEKRMSLQNGGIEAEENKVDTLASDRTDTLRFGHSGGAKKYEKEIKLNPRKDALDMPETTITWIVRFGYIGIFIALIYLLAAIFLLIPKKFSIMLAYSALVLSIAFNATKTIVLTSSGSSSGVIALTMGATQLFGIILDIILLSVIFSAEDKQAFTS